jgi:hypothetical protein
MVMARHPVTHLSAYDNTPEVQDGTTLLESFPTLDRVPGWDSPPDITRFKATHLRKIHVAQNYLSVTFTRT